MKGLQMNGPVFSHSSLLAEELMSKGYCIERELMRTSAVNALAEDLAPTFAATARSQGLFYGNRT